MTVGSPRRARVVISLAAATTAALTLTCVPVLTANNVVSAGHLSAVSRTVAPNDMKPVQCVGITLTAKQAGSGVMSVATSDPTLVLGSADSDIITGNSGDDCIVGGGGSDTLDGGAGYDICISSSGTSITCEESYAG